MHYVYILESEAHAGRFYIGETDDLKRRFKQHNAGASIHTANYRPWRIVWYSGFADPATALRFEKYLKSASGRAFQKRHLAAQA
jgi:predicted GIY-YIG superfamily endonuclease